MYPRNFFGLFPPFPRNDNVFVAMSFNQRFDARWQNVIVPGIQKVRVNGVSLQAHRVDAGRISDSILTEILGGITNDRVIFADISTVAYADGAPFRNANVMYELGLAHAVRLPEEVVQFRSDKDPLLFDVANLRVNTYDPDQNPELAQQQVADSIVGAINELDLKRQLAVKAGAEALDYPCWDILLLAFSSGSINHFPLKTMGQAVGNASKNAAISRLLEMGALDTHFSKVTVEMIKANEPEGLEQLLNYRLTAFGNAILKYATEETGLADPVVQALLQNPDSNPAGDGGAV